MTALEAILGRSLIFLWSWYLIFYLAYIEAVTLLNSRFAKK